MTTNTHATRTVIGALEALSPDALKMDDDATFDRLRDLAERLGTLIGDEQERRWPTPDIDLSALSERWERGREERASRAAEYRARQKARRATIREVIEYCASKPDLHARVKELFPMGDES